MTRSASMRATSRGPPRAPPLSPPPAWPGTAGASAAAPAGSSVSARVKLACAGASATAALAILADRVGADVLGALPRLVEEPVERRGATARLGAQDRRRISGRRREADEQRISVVILVPPVGTVQRRFGVSRTRTKPPQAAAGQKGRARRWQRFFADTDGAGHWRPPRPSAAVAHDEDRALGHPGKLDNYRSMPWRERRRRSGGPS
jgi:hypothetical protein